MKITRQINMIDKVGLVIRLTLLDRLVALFTGRLILIVEDEKQIIKEVE